MTFYDVRRKWPIINWQRLKLRNFHLSNWTTTVSSETNIDEGFPSNSWEMNKLRRLFYPAQFFFVSSICSSYLGKSRLTFNTNDFFQIKLWNNRYFAPFEFFVTNWTCYLNSDYRLHLGFFFFFSVQLFYKSMSYLKCNSRVKVNLCSIFI